MQHSYLASTGAHRPLLTEKPKMNSLLPADDDGWDRGVSYHSYIPPSWHPGKFVLVLTLYFKEHVVPERLFLSSSEQISASPFARLAQASHLLGEVVRHCNSDMSQPSIVLEELNLLYQTICALLDVLMTHKATTIRFHSAIAVCLR